MVDKRKGKTLIELYGEKRAAEIKLNLSRAASVRILSDAGRARLKQRRASEETKEKMREAHLGVKRPREVREAISRGHRMNRRSGEDRASYRGRAWREAILKRDNYTCLECGETELTKLHAHHTKPWEIYPEFRFDLNRGKTLCTKCHRKADVLLHTQNSLKLKEIAEKLKLLQEDPNLGATQSFIEWLQKTLE